MKKIVIFVALSLLLSVLLSSSFDKRKMEQFFSHIAEHEKGMGSFAINRDGREVYQRSIGFFDTNRQIKRDTKIRIGSITKTYTAVVIMQMVDEGKLSLDKKLSRFFPEIPGSDDITILQMLKHQSGLYNYTDSSDFGTASFRPVELDILLEIISEHELAFSPGEAEAYSNSNFLLLSLIAEQIDKKSLSKIYNDRIFKKLKLKNTYLADTLNPKKKEALSFLKVDSWVELPSTHGSWLSGTGGIVSTASEVNAFFHGLFSGKLVSTESLAEMLKIDFSFGIGLINIPFYEKIGFGHTGGINGFQSIALFIPDEAVAITYLANGIAMSRNDLLIGAMSIYFGREYDFPNFLVVPVDIDREILVSYTGNYVSDDLPIQIRVFIDGDRFQAQGTGQIPFPLTAIDERIFQFEMGGIRIEFVPETNEFVLYQGGGVFRFRRD
jgi:CubicO group peptidase (beta-lactamase class C family)